MTEENNTELTNTPKAVGLSSSTPKKTRLEMLRRITRQTDPETVLKAFQKQFLGGVGGSADQVLTRGVQKSAEDILTSRDAEVEDTPSGFFR